MKKKQKSLSAQIAFMMVALQIIIALPDCTRFAHLAFTGEHCIIADIRVEQTETEMTEDMIPRIAEAISYIDLPQKHFSEMGAIKTGIGKARRFPFCCDISFWVQTIPFG